MEESKAALPAIPISARLWYRAVVCVVTLALYAVVALFGTATILCCGPSPAARDRFVAAATEHESLRLLVRLYFSEERVQEILDAHEARSYDPEGLRVD